MHWKFFTGEYEKKEYTIMLKDGTIKEWCYPNAGTFHDLDTGDVVGSDDVLMISPCIKRIRG